MPGEELPDVVFVALDRPLPAFNWVRLAVAATATCGRIGASGPVQVETATLARFSTDRSSISVGTIGQARHDRISSGMFVQSQ
jgi:hypothetical protein